MNLNILFDIGIFSGIITNEKLYIHWFAYNHTFENARTNIMDDL